MKNSNKPNNIKYFIYGIIILVIISFIILIYFFIKNKDKCPDNSYFKKIKNNKTECVQLYFYDLINIKYIIDNIFNSNIPYNIKNCGEPLTISNAFDNKCINNKSLLVISVNSDKDYVRKLDNDTTLEQKLSNTNITSNFINYKPQYKITNSFNIFTTINNTFRFIFPNNKIYNFTLSDNNSCGMIIETDDNDKDKILNPVGNPPINSGTKESIISPCKILIDDFICQLYKPEQIKDQFITDYNGDVCFCLVLFHDTNKNGGLLSP
jgi:hypothetical protein